jgi:hypothetical protein
MYEHFPFQGPPKNIQKGIFGLKLYHLATLKHFSVRNGVEQNGHQAGFRFLRRRVVLQAGNRSRSFISALLGGLLRLPFGRIDCQARQVDDLGSTLPFLKRFRRKMLLKLLF